MALPRQTRAVQHWFYEGERSGEQKWLTFRPVRSELVCVQLNNTILSLTFDKLLKDGLEHIWAFLGITVST